MGLQLAADLSVLGRQRALSAEGVDRLALSHSGEPCTRVVGGPVAGPLAERVRERVLSKVLGQCDVAGEAGQHRDHLWELDPVGGLDRGG